MHTAPHIAAVRPRVLLQNGVPGEAELLVDLVEERLADRARGVILLSGPRGSGKSTALRFLAQHFQGRAEFHVCHATIQPELVPRAKDGLILGASLDPTCAALARERWTIAPWTVDDRIEYLLARHPDRVASVMRRSSELPPAFDLVGLPELWTRVLDELARDELVPSALSALIRICERCLASTGDAEIVESDCLRRVCLGTSSGLIELLDSVRGTDLDLIANNPGSRHAIAARTVCASFMRNRLPESFSMRFPATLVAAVAELLPRDKTQSQRLASLARDKHTKRATNAIDILHVVDSPAVREAFRGAAGAQVSFLAWSGARLPGVDLSALFARGPALRGADLSCASLASIRLTQASLTDADLSDADLDSAVLTRVRAERADFSSARAHGLRADRSSFQGARFALADLEGAVFSRCALGGADFSGANLNAAWLGGCDLLHATFEHTDLRGADLNSAVVGAVDFETTALDGACFHAADLQGARFENLVVRGLDLRGAELERALFSGSRLSSSTLRGANLRSCGLADVDWEGVDLGDVDFSNASFHLGSTRSGLLVGAPAMWGSLTGYYSSDEADVERIPPEDLRKANLSHCNLLGAKVAACDFFRVDLRGARYSADQEAHFRACRAILDPRSR